MKTIKLDLDELTATYKAIKLFIQANECYTNAYGSLEKSKQTSNSIVANRVLAKLIAESEA